MTTLETKLLQIQNLPLSAKKQEVLMILNEIKQPGDFLDKLYQAIFVLKQEHPELVDTAIRLITLVLERHKLINKRDKAQATQTRLQELEKQEAKEREKAEELLGKIE